MSTLVAYVFLLDNLMGFRDTLNETVNNIITPDPYFHESIRVCDPHMTQLILNAVSRELSIDVPALHTNIDNSINSANEDSQELLYNALIEASIREVGGKQEIYEKALEEKSHTLDTFELDTDQVYRRTSHENRENATNLIKEITEFPKYAPFLVAIFETMSNLTAQTCAGTLVSSHWVLTAANCVNVLGKLYANSTNTTHTQTLYTVVAGAIDPLTDGSVHNVTTILEPHKIACNTSRHRKRNAILHGPYLAMMRIEPAFEGASLTLMEDNVKKGDVTIYGWLLSKNASGSDTLNMVNITALILTEAECQAMYSYYNSDVICLYNNNKFQNVTQLSSGSPVLIQQGGEVKLLAVAQTDDDVFIAFPLHVHINWIKKVLNS